MCNCKLEEHYDEILQCYNFPIYDIAPHCAKSNYFKLELNANEQSALIDISMYNKISIFPNINRKEIVSGTVISYFATLEEIENGTASYIKSIPLSHFLNSGGDICIGKHIRIVARSKLDILIYLSR
jgi:hypothetical protein